MLTKSLLYLPLFLIHLLVTVIANNLPVIGNAPVIATVPIAQWSKTAQALAAKFPSGSMPAYVAKPPRIPKSDPQQINFYSETGNGGCTGDGANAEITIPAADFMGAKLCPSGGTGTSGDGDSIEDVSGTFSIGGNLGPCQLHFYTKDGCNTADWAGYFTGPQQTSYDCQEPLRPDQSTIDGVVSFNYICPDTGS
ncbi:hypothetical protein P7C71_g2100, partial [Lecanoromycetidae sp. Uapishka_2]